MSEDAKLWLILLGIGITVIVLVLGGAYLYKSNQPAEGWDAVAEDLDTHGGTVHCDSSYWQINTNDDVTAEGTGLLVHKANGDYLHLNYSGITTVAIKG